MFDLLLRGGLVVTPDGPTTADVAIVDGRVVEVAREVAGERADELDCSGCWIGPGLVDLHTHLREPGEEWKEDVESGSEAAAAGGYTAVVAMPNTSPPIDAGHLARFVAERGRQTGLVEVVPAGAITMGLSGQRLAHLDELFDAGVRLFTDDGATVADAGLLRRAMEYVGERGGLIAQHAEDAGLSAGGHVHEGMVSSRLGMTGIPAAAEEVIVARDLTLTRLTGARYHVQHVSSARTVELLAAAKAEGLPVTAEVTPHHLIFDESAVAATDPAYKMYPPLRSEEDRRALREALAEGVIDAVATDHAPHASHEKDVPFEEAPRGVIGLETAAAAVYTAGIIDPTVFFDRLAVSPARIVGLAGHGRQPERGAPANLAVFDPETDWTPDQFVSRSENSPFRSTPMTGRVVATVLGGRFTYRDGKVVR